MAFSEGSHSWTWTLASFAATKAIPKPICPAPSTPIYIINQHTRLMPDFAACILIFNNLMAEYADSPALTLQFNTNHRCMLSGLVTLKPSSDSETILRLPSLVWCDRLRETTGGRKKSFASSCKQLDMVGAVAGRFNGGVANVSYSGAVNGRCKRGRWSSSSSSTPYRPLIRLVEGIDGNRYVFKSKLQVLEWEKFDVCISDVVSTIVLVFSVVWDDVSIALILSLLRLDRYHNNNPAIPMATIAHGTTMAIGIHHVVLVLV